MRFHQRHRKKAKGPSSQSPFFTKQGEGANTFFVARKENNKQVPDLQAKDCPDYNSPAEIARSKTNAGFFGTSAVTFDGSGQPALLQQPGSINLREGFREFKLVIRDFGVGWRQLKPSVLSNPTFRLAVDNFENIPNYEATVLGYSDCVGSSSRNSFLRFGRARRVRNAFGPNGRARTNFVFGAPLNQFRSGNSSPAERANNRAVEVFFSPRTVV